MTNRTITSSRTRDGITWSAEYSGGPYIDVSVLGMCVDVIDASDVPERATRSEIGYQLAEWLKDNKTCLADHLMFARQALR